MMTRIISAIFLFCLSASLTHAQLSDADRALLQSQYKSYYQEQMELARTGDADAQYAVAVFLAGGSGGVDVNAEKSIEWAQKAADQDHMDAQRLLAIHKHFESNSERIRQSFSTGELKFPAWHILRKIQKVPEQKILDGQLQKFGRTYKTAEMGYPKSHLELARMYFEGEGTKKDNLEAAFWMHIARASSHSNDERLFRKITDSISEEDRRSTFYRARYWLKDHEIQYEETSWVLPADNNPGFLFKTTDYLYEPVPQTRRSGTGTMKVAPKKPRYTPMTKEELEHYEATMLRAEAGDNAARLELVQLIIDQKGTLYDKEEIRKWIKLAADDGNAEAIHRLIDDRNLERSMNNISKEEMREAVLRYLPPLAENGDSRAQAKMAYYLYRGRVLDKNHAEAFKWALIGVENYYDRSSAFSTLSNLYYDGENIDHDIVKAYKWGLVSRRKNRRMLNERLRNMAAEMTSEQLRQAEAAATKWITDNQPERLDKFLGALGNSLS